MRVQTHAFTSSVDEQAFITLWQEMALCVPHASVFHSDMWCRAILNIAKQQLIGLSFWAEQSHTESCVGICLVGVRQQKSCGISMRHGYLNQCGQAIYDQPWVEYNDILVIPEFAAQCRHQLLQYCHGTLACDAVFIRTTHVTAADWGGLHHKKTAQVSGERVVGYLAELPQMQQVTLADILTQYSTNTRSQIRRAIKYIEREYGAITCALLKHHDALAEFANIAHLHAERWRDSEHGSGFDNPLFCAFHRELLSTEDDDIDVHILQFSTPALTLGYLYNFVKDGHVYFYLSAINYADKDNKFKSGLVMHALAQWHYAQSGAHTYDFLGGECRYKASLSTREYAFNDVTSYNTSLKKQLFSSAQKIKALLSS